MGKEDGDATKRAVRDQWAEKAPMWDRRADEIAKLAERLNRPLVEAAGLAPGDRVLDLGSGTGEPALSLSAEVRAEGTVVATDLVPEMLAGARRRAAERGLANIVFHVADMEKLPFADRSFDAVTCRFGLMFCPQPVRALGEALRVLRPDGRAVFMVWGPREDTTIFRVLAAAAAKVFGDDAEADMTTPFRLGAEGILAGLLNEAGFSAVEEQALRFTPTVPAGRPFWRAQADMSLGRLLEATTPERRRAFEAAVTEGFAPFLDGDSYRLSAHVRMGVGVRPPNFS